MLTQFQAHTYRLDLPHPLHGLCQSVVGPFAQNCHKRAWLQIELIGFEYEQHNNNSSNNSSSYYQLNTQTPKSPLGEIIGLFFTNKENTGLREVGGRAQGHTADWQLGFEPRLV